MEEYEEILTPEELADRSMLVGKSPPTEGKRNRAMRRKVRKRQKLTKRRK